MIEEKKAVKKSVSLIANTLAVFASLFLTTLVAILCKMTTGQIVDALTFALPLIVMSLILSDMSFKITQARELLTWQYFVGFAFVSGAIYSWFWASTSMELWDMIFRLVITFLVSFAGGAWMRFGYRPSVQDKKELMQEKWNKFTKKVLASDDSVGNVILGCNLRYHFVGDDLVKGIIDFNRPIANYPGRGPLTLEEIATLPNDDPYKSNFGNEMNSYIEFLLSQKKKKDGGK